MSLIDYKTLYKLYVIDELSTTDLGKMFNKHHTTILNNLKKLNIPLRHTHTNRSKAKISITSSGTNNPMYVNGVKQLKGGYIGIRCELHPCKNSQGYVPEHRLVMECHLHRYLLPTEVIHHIDGNTRNNKIENLKLCSTQAEHANIHKMLATS
jgi:hypothetical protein